MRITAEEVLRAHATVGEVAASAARNADLLGKLLGVIDQQHAPPALSGGGGAHHAGGARTDDQHIVVTRTGVRSGRGKVRHVSTCEDESGAEYAPCCKAAIATPIPAPPFTGRRAG